MTPKKLAWQWMSRWVRLKDVLDTARRFGFDKRDMMAQCFTCGAFVCVTKRGGGQAGHFRSRGHGGSSGLYFDERAIRVQCAKCNAWRQGRPDEFREGLVDEYGEETVQELERLHKMPSRWGPKDYPLLTMLYKREVETLLEENGLRKWWK
jgi:hypothetical protein